MAVQADFCFYGNVEASTSKVIMIPGILSHHDWEASTSSVLQAGQSANDLPYFTQVASRDHRIR